LNIFLNLSKTFLFAAFDGVKFDDLFICERAFFSLSLNVSGTYTFTLINWSPVPYPFTDGSPLFRSRNTFPGCVPGSIFILATPSMVGTSTVPPNAAVGKLINRL